MAGILALFGKPKGSSSKGGEGLVGGSEDMGAAGGAESELAGEAFDALKDGDREGFVSAFIEAVRVCSRKAKAGGYEDGDEL